MLFGLAELTDSTPPLTASPHCLPRTIATSLTDYTGVPEKGETSIFYVAPAGQNRPNYREVSPQWVNPSGKESSQEFYISQDVEGQYALGVTGEPACSCRGRLCPGADGIEYFCRRLRRPVIQMVRNPPSGEFSM
jgi:hypothetical protein